MLVEISVILTTTWMAVAGSVAISIPLLIHLLFRRRTKPVEWAAMQFLKEAWSSNRKRIRLEQISLLIIRCGIPLILGLALSQPILEGSNLFTPTSTTLHLIIDDGIVSSSMNPDGLRDFDTHIKHANTLLDSLGPGDQVSITMAGDSSNRISTTTDTEAARVWLGGLSPTQNQTRINEAIQHVYKSLHPGEGQGDRKVFILSSFRAGSVANLTGHGVTFPPGVSLLYSHPFQEDRENTRIENLEPLRNILVNTTPQNTPTIERTIMVHMVRDGEILPASTSQLNISTGGPAKKRVFTWQEGESSRIVGIKLPQGSGSADGVHVQLSGDDALNMDNSRYLSIDTRESINILLVDRPASPDTGNTGTTPNSSRWIQYALQPTTESPYQIQSIDPAVLRGEDMTGVDVLVLTRPDLLDPTSESWMKNHIDSGGLILVTPPERQGNHDWMSAISRVFNVPWSTPREPRVHSPPLTLVTPTASVNSRSTLEIIKGELPSLLESVRVQKSLLLEGVEPEQVLISLDDGTPAIISRGSWSGTPGELLLMAFPPSPTWTDLPTKPLMVPLFQELVRGGLSTTGNSNPHVVGEFIDVGHMGDASYITHGETIQIPVIEDTGQSSLPIPNQGVWSIFDYKGVVLGTVALNIQPTSADTSPSDSDTITGWLGEEWTPTSPQSSKVAGTPVNTLVYPLLLFLTILVITETIMSRIFTRVPARGNR